MHLFLFALLFGHIFDSCVSAIWQAPTLTIGAFNAQIIGQKKVQSENTMNTVVRIVCRYDVISISEVRDISQTSIFVLLDKINRKCNKKYGFRVSCRSGSGNSQEQIVFFFRLDTVDPVSTSTVSHESKTERAPFFGLFKSMQVPSFKFLYMAVHIKPDMAVEEMNALVPMYRAAVRKFKTEISSAFIMGDFNADCKYVLKKNWESIKMFTDKSFTWLIPTGVDTTTARASVCTYDRIVMDERFLPSVVPGSAAPFKYDKEFGFVRERASDISDHYPIEMKLVVKKLAIHYKGDPELPFQKPWSIFNYFPVVYRRPGSSATPTLANEVLSGESNPRLVAPKQPAKPRAPRRKKSTGEGSETESETTSRSTAHEHGLEVVKKQMKKRARSAPKLKVANLVKMTESDEEDDWFPGSDDFDDDDASF